MLLETVSTTLIEAPTRLSNFLDACTCGRADKAAVQSIKKELEAKDSAIERLEEEIRRKDSEKENLIHMQKDLQAQIEEIRLLLDNHATEVRERLSDDAAAELMQRRARGILGRKKVATVRDAKQKQKQYADTKGKDPVAKLQAAQRGKHDRKAVEVKKQQAQKAQMLQARVRGKSARKLTAERMDKGELPGQKRGSTPPPMPYGGGPHISESADFDGGAAEADLDREDVMSGGAPIGFSEEGGSSLFDENESVDSDYDYDESAFTSLGEELLAGQLKLAKVYGQEEPPAAEDELEWEVRYFVLYNSGRIVHYDEMADGLPVGDRGLIDLSTIRTVEKVVGVPTFVMKGASKVYLFKLEPHDEVMMRTWIAAISQELAH